MLFNKSYTGLIMLAGMTLAGCAADPIPTPQSELYTREFIKQFGLFDPSHDWNMAARSSVTVSTSMPTDVKIYARVDGVRYLFATYRGVNGTRQLKVDIPKGVSSLIVRADGRDYDVASGGSVNLSGSRAMFPAEAGPGTLHVRRAQRQYDIVKPASYINKYAEILPEGKGNLNRENISLNFKFKQTNSDPIVIYPVLWNSGSTNTLGIYYTDANGKYHEQDLYVTKDGDCLRRRTYNDNNVLSAETPCGIGSLSWLKTIIEDLELSQDATSFTSEEKKAVLDAMVAQGWRARGQELALEPEPPVLYLPGDTYNGETVTAHNVRIDGIKWEWENLKGAQATLPEYIVKHVTDNPDDGSRYVYESSGIVVDIPVGQVYGFFIRRNDGVIRYSESHKNPKTINYYYEYAEDGTPKQVPLDYYYHVPNAATFSRKDLVDGGTPDQASTFCRVCFEDWLVSESSDHDLNDMVFYIGGIDDDEVIEGDDPWKEDLDVEYQWIIAAEDLGNIDDFDFNDVVFSVSAPELIEGDGTYVKVRALAAGGTMPVYLYYKDQLLSPEWGDGEFHSWFDKGSYMSTTVINAEKVRADGAVIKVKVEDDFTISCRKEHMVSNGNMGGFHIVVKGKEEQVVTPPIFSTDGTSGAPQMICVPYDWSWPLERHHITSAYSRFINWCESADNHDWHLNPATEHVWKRTDLNTGGGGGNQTSSGLRLTPAETSKGVWGNDNAWKYEYVLSEDVKSKIAACTKATVNVDMSNCEYYDMGADGQNNNLIQQHRVSSVVLDADKLEILKSASTISVYFWSCSDAEKFNGGISLLLE